MRLRIGRHLMRRAARILREYGVRALWFEVWSHFFYRRLYLLERSLADPIPEVPTGVPLTMDWLPSDGAREYEQLLAFRGNPELYDERFALGHCCLTARYQGRIIAGMWAARQHAWIWYLKAAVPMREGDVYLYDAFTDPEFRGKAIAPALSTELLRRFREQGARRAIRGTVPDNRQALRAHEKAGFRPYALMGYFRFRSWRRDFLRPWH